MNGAMLLPEFDHEMANTRKTLARVPNDKLEFKPHEKSFTLLALASHISNVPAWVEMTLQLDELDVSGPFERDEPTNTEELLAEFDENVKKARGIIEAATGEQLATSWTMKMDGAEVFTMPKAAVFRSFIMNHMVHHRAQLTVYLRLLDVPVPALYGPSADEQE